VKRTIPTADFRAVVDQAIRERHDEHGDGGLDRLAREVEASGLMSYAAAARGFNRIRTQPTVSVDFVDRVLTAIGRPDIFVELVPLDVDELVDEPKRRGGWSRPDRHRFARAEVETIYRLHTELGLSLREIARRLYPRLGYASEASCLETIRLSLKREGFRARPQPIATTLSNQARRQRPAGETKSEYKRRRRREPHGYRDSRTGEWRTVSDAA
jgi:hypothetical protein